MATCLRHAPRLLSPGETLLYALLPSTTSLSSNRPLVRPYQQNRTLKQKRSRQLPPGFDLNRILQKTSSDPLVRETERLSSRTLDEDIASRWVVVKDTLTGKLSAPQLLTALLSQIDRSTYSVNLLASEGPQQDTAVVEVRSRQEMLDQMEEKKQRLHEQQKQQRVKSIKQIELNWAISSHDLELKLKQLAGFLDKGKIVEVLLANKKRQRRAGEDEARATLSKVRERIEEVGAQEKNMEGQIGGSATLTVERKASADS